MFVAMHLAVGVGLSGPNIATLNRVASCVKVKGLIFVIAADWNMEADEMHGLNLPTYLRGARLRPACQHPGGHRVIDYCLVSEQLLGLVALRRGQLGP